MEKQGDKHQKWVVEKKNMEMVCISKRCHQIFQHLRTLIPTFHTIHSTFGKVFSKIILATNKLMPILGANDTILETFHRCHLETIVTYTSRRHFFLSGDMNISFSIQRASSFFWFLTHTTKFQS